jgi:hypothetical protein
MRGAGGRGARGPVAQAAVGRCAPDSRDRRALRWPDTHVRRMRAGLHVRRMVVTAGNEARQEDEMMKRSEFKAVCLSGCYTCILKIGGSLECAREATSHMSLYGHNVTILPAVVQS